ncbi:hypothetical protein FACS1894188_08240 [Clostridia bacterium]|nr:hypothetical protein FACS1894188_08240 [Clostridia bacterium]
MDKRLYVSMFGVFDITFEGASILSGMGNSGKALDILKFLIIQNGVVFLPETIVSEIWPSNEYADEKKVVRTYIHRLRKILSAENSLGIDFSEYINIVNIKGSYKAELSDGVTLDTDVFQNYCHSVIAEDDTDRLLELFNKITDLCKRNFMSENYSDSWVIAFRNQYSRVFCDSVNNIIEKLKPRVAPEIVRELCEKTLKIHELDERINLHFIRAMIDSRQIVGATQHYKYITEKMYAELNLPPSEKMREISRELNLDKSDALTAIIRDIIKETQAESSVSIGIVKLVSNSASANLNNALSALRSALDHAMRKGDLFAMAGDSAIIVLFGAREEYYKNISERINLAFLKNTAHFGCTLDIQIYPAISK